MGTASSVLELPVLQLEFLEALLEHLQLLQEGSLRALLLLQALLEVSDDRVVLTSDVSALVLKELGSFAADTLALFVQLLKTSYVAQS